MWKAFAFGVVVAGAIGPIALLIFGTGARQGFAAGAFAGLGAALADLLYALAAFLAGALVLPYFAHHERAIEAGCALLLVALGAWMLIGQLRPGDAPAVPKAAAHAFLPTFLLTVVNPLTFVMFAGVVPQLPVERHRATAVCRRWTVRLWALASASSVARCSALALGVGRQ